MALDNSRIVKILRALISYVLINTGCYPKKKLPEYDFSLLTEKWPYINPNCIANSYKKNTNVKDVLLSICIPMYNAESTILTLLNQIDCQKTNFLTEVILVNDGSTDNTESVVKNFIKGKKHYYLFSQKNAGLSSARNLAIRNASGEYLTFVDSDDEICDGFIENLMSAALSFNADIVKGQYYSKSGRHIQLSGVVSGYIWGQVFRASLFDLISFPDGYWFEDMINSFLLVPLADKIIEIKTPVMIHNNVAGSLSKVQLVSKEYKSLEHLYLVMSLVKDYKTLGLTLTNGQYLKERLIAECSYLMVQRIRRLDKDTKMQVFLTCHRLFVEHRIDPKRYSGINQMFADSIIRKDFNAWILTANWSVLYYGIISTFGKSAKARVHKCRFIMNL